MYKPFAFVSAVSVWRRWLKTNVAGVAGATVLGNDKKSEEFDMLVGETGVRGGPTALL
jgi:hypothetical protein